MTGPKLLKCFVKQSTKKFPQTLQILKCFAKQHSFVKYSKCLLKWMIHIWRIRKLYNFQDPPLLSIYIRNSLIPLTLDVQFQTNPSPYSNDNQSIKSKHDPRMTIICYQQRLLSLKNSFTVWCQGQKVDFFSIVYSCVWLTQHDVWSWYKSDFN